MNVLKSYQTKNRYGKVLINLYKDRAEISEKGRKAYSKDFQKILTDDTFPLCDDVKIEYDITKQICGLLNEKDYTDKKLLQKLKFYDLYNPKLCKGFKYDHSIKFPYNTVNQKLELNRYGLKITDKYGIRNILKPDRLFFAGPYAECLPLDIRKKLKLTIYNSLGKQNKLSLDEGFPVLDYEKIYEESFSERIGDWNKGAEFLVKNGYIEYNGWSGPKDGGGTTFGIEWFLYYEKNLFSLLTNNDFDHIYEAFCAFILKHEIN